MNDRFSPGARFSAIIAASMQMVPEPQNGSQKKSRPRYRARFTMAAMIALNRAPGLNRSFMAQKWSCVPETIWQQARTEALDREYRGEYHILGSDIDPASLEIAQQNARKAGVCKLIEFREADATKMSLPTDKGLLVCNPPYGERMLEQRSAQRLYGAFGRHLKYADGWKKYIISSEPEFEHYFGRQAVKKRKLYNGRLQCNVYMYY